MVHLQNLSRILIDRDALIHNVQILKELAPGSLFAAVVKSNAYGHGFEEVVSVLKGKVDWFAVNTIAEMLQLRKQDVKTPVLIMGLNGYDLHCLDSLEDVSNVHLVVTNKASIKRIIDNHANIQFHLKIDTGLSRLGISQKEFTELLPWLKENALQQWTGLMTHFANVEDVSDQSYAQEQLSLFDEVCKAALKIKAEIICHASASAAGMILPNARLDLIRAGIVMYGLWPASQTRLSLLSQNAQIPNLKPVLQWETQIIQIHKIKAGSYVGYGCTSRVERDTTIAILPIGYYEGYDRALSNQNYVLIQGKRAPILGRISMNMTIVDISLVLNAKEGDRAILIGEDNGEKITADQLATQAGTINYEIVTRILPEIERVVI